MERNKNFAHFLQQMGYIPYELDMKVQKFFNVKDPDFISSYGPINIEFFPSWLGPEIPLNAVVNRSKNFCYGLHEHGHSPCLIYPRPYVLWTNDLNELRTTKIYPDIIMDRIISKYTCEEIYYAIEQNNILIV